VEPRPTARNRVRLTPRDLELLGFAAEHHLVLPDHARALLGASADAARARLAALARAGFLTGYRPFHARPSCYQITSRGLGAIGSDLRPPRQLDLRSYEHEVGAGWLWLAARSGRFGRLRDVVAERRLRSEDARPERAEPPYGVRLGGLGPRGRERLHYPDLLLVSADGRRIAVELELSSKGRARREGILAGYGAAARIDAVLYLVRDRRIGRSIQDSARRLGIGPLVHVQPVALPGAERASGAAQAAARSAPARAAAAEAVR
jgi:hypothetical protein